MSGLNFDSTGLTSYLLFDSQNNNDDGFSQDFFDNVFDGHNSDIFTSKDSQQLLVDLPTPTITTTDDFLDKLLRELDVQNQNNNPSTFCVGDNPLDDVIDYCCELNNDESSSSSSETSPPLVYADPPPFTESVEIELTQEHSYAAPLHTQPSSSASAASLSPFSDSGISSESRLSPFSCRTSHRSSCSTSESYDQPTTTSTSSYKIDILEEAFKTIDGSDSDDNDDVEIVDDTINKHSPHTTYVYQPPAPKKEQSFFKRNFKGRRASSNKCVLPFSSKDIKDDYLAKYPPLILTDEEKVLCEREGILLPTKFPLTKQEENALKRIRRKIRNKQSAHASREKQRQYIADLENRVNAYKNENHVLKMEFEKLKKSNSTLVGQLRKLQAAVGNGSRPAVQAGVCLSVLLLSFALLIAPNYSPFGKRKLPADDQNNSITSPNAGDEPNRALLPGNTRTLLQTSALIGTDNDDDEAMENEQEQLVRRMFGRVEKFAAVDLPVYDDGDNVSVDDWFLTKENKKLVELGSLLTGKKKIDVVDNAYLTPPPSKRFKSSPTEIHGIDDGDASSLYEEGNETKTRIYLTRNTAKQIKIEEL